MTRNGETLLRSGYGLANEEWGIPNTPTTKFRIGSVTKMFTAAAVLHLSVDRSAGIGEFLDDLPETWRALTIHQLLTHTSGLKDHLAAPAKRTMNRTGATPRELAGLIANEPLLFEPGTGCAYSNTGYILLGLLIEKLSGQSYASYLEERMLRPAALTSTSYDSASVILPERASGYVPARDGIRNADYLDMSVPFSAGGLISTLNDLLRWNTLLHGGQVLNPESYAAMTVRYPEARIGDDFYGYGLFIGAQSDYTRYSHSGGVNGFIAMLQYYPEIQSSLIVLTNLFHPAAMQRVVERLSRQLLDPSTEGVAPCV
jgi:CubicO group peptidase (beta-lactamase class C family)